MKYNVMVEIPESKVSFVEEFFKAISFVKEVIPITPNEITNREILQSINSYENGTTQPVIINLEDLKQLIYA
jgi:hypothetical protein